MIKYYHSLKKSSDSFDPDHTDHVKAGAIIHALLKDLENLDASKLSLDIIYCLKEIDNAFKHLVKNNKKDQVLIEIIDHYKSQILSHDSQSNHFRELANA